LEVVLNGIVPLASAFTKNNVLLAVMNRFFPLENMMKLMKQKTIHLVKKIKKILTEKKKIV